MMVTIVGAAVHELNILCVAAADQSRVMQEQMTGAAMAMPPDPNKAFKVRSESYV